MAAKRQLKLEDSLYERDFYVWTQEQGEKLRSRAIEEIDWDNLAEDIESVGAGRKGRSAIGSMLC